jgi:osmoprotectant transport system ATP-binding protein
MPAAEALRAEALSKRYRGELALDQVSLSIAEGECVALVGESGAGKTTLLRCFNRLIEPDAGTVRLNGEDARRLDPVLLRRRIGYVPQEGGLLPHWRVLRNVALVPLLQKDPGAAQRARQALSQVGLDPEDFGERWPVQLSGGQRQRVALARALAGQPKLVLLDEPFGALDALTRDELQKTLGEVRRSIVLTAVLVTHDLDEALRLADRIAVLRAGRLEQVGPERELLEQPATPYVRALFERRRKGPS